MKDCKKDCKKERKYERPFTDEEYERMISELTDAEQPSYYTLCEIADRAFRARVKAWCASDLDLRGRDMENDIMQEIFLRLIKTTVTHFLKRKDHNGEINRNPDEFMRWITTVAKNIKRDAAGAIRNRDYREPGSDDGPGGLPAPPNADDDENEYRQMTLAEAFQIVLDSDGSVYKILTWLAQSLYIITFDLTKIQATDALVALFSERTLFEMRDSVFACATMIDWINITPEQTERINQMLNTASGDQLLGEKKFEEFFMKKGGKASVSDWVNRMNKLIARRKKKWNT